MFGRFAMGFANVRAGTRVLMLVLVQAAAAGEKVEYRWKDCWWRGEVVSLHRAGASSSEVVSLQDGASSSGAQQAEVQSAAGTPPAHDGPFCLSFRPRRGESPSTPRIACQAMPEDRSEGARIAQMWTNAMPGMRLERFGLFLSDPPGADPCTLGMPM